MCTLKPNYLKKKRYVIILVKRYGRHFVGPMNGQYYCEILKGCVSNLWSWVDCELQLGFLSVVDGESFHEQRREPGTRSAAETVEDEESLETGALIGQLPDSVEDDIDNLLADGVVAAGVVVGGVLLARDELFRVEQLTISSGTNFI